MLIFYWLHITSRNVVKDVLVHTKLGFKSTRFAGASFVYIILFICLKETIFGSPIQQRSLSFVNISFYLRVSIGDCGLRTANCGGSCYYLSSFVFLFSCWTVVCFNYNYRMFNVRSKEYKYLYDSSAWCGCVRKISSNWIGCYWIGFIINHWCIFSLSFAYPTHGLVVCKFI